MPLSNRNAYLAGTSLLIVGVLPHRHRVRQNAYFELFLDGMLLRNYQMSNHDNCRIEWVILLRCSTSISGVSAHPILDGILEDTKKNLIIKI